MVGGCDDGCYIWKLYDGSSDKSDKNSKIRLAYISDDLKAGHQMSHLVLE